MTTRVITLKHLFDANSREFLFITVTQSFIRSTQLFWLWLSVNAVAVDESKIRVCFLFNLVGLLKDMSHAWKDSRSMSRSQCLCDRKSDWDKFWKVCRTEKNVTESIKSILWCTIISYSKKPMIYHVCLALQLKSNKIITLWMWV